MCALDMKLSKGFLNWMILQIFEITWFDTAGFEWTLNVFC